MIDPEAEIVEASDSQTGASRLILRSEAEAEPRPLPDRRDSQIAGGRA